jgi:hypothetical protein
VVDCRGFPENNPPTCARVGDISGFLIEFPAELLAAAFRRILRALYQIADPRGRFAGQAFDPDAVGGVVGDLYVFVLERAAGWRS